VEKAVLTCDHMACARLNAIHHIGSAVAFADISSFGRKEEAA